MVLCESPSQPIHLPPSFRFQAFLHGTGLQRLVTRVLNNLDRGKRSLAQRQQVWLLLCFSESCLVIMARRLH